MSETSYISYVADRQKRILRAMKSVYKVFRNSNFHYK